MTPSELAPTAARTRMGGTLHVYFTHVRQSRHGKGSARSGNELVVKSMYLYIEHRFNDAWSIYLAPEFTYTSVSGRSRLFFKKAYMQRQFGPLATLRLGLADEPWISFVEDLYGYHYVEDNLIDRLNFGQTVDWGVHLSGDNGTINYQVALVNGAGRKLARSRSADIEGRVGFQPFTGFTVGIGAYAGGLGKNTRPATVFHTARRYDVVAAWNRDGLRLGVAWFRADNWRNVTTPAHDSAEGWWAWGSYDFGSAALFARNDRVSPSKVIDPSLADVYYNFGVSFQAAKGVKIAVAYTGEHLYDSNGVDVKNREIGVWGEVKF